MHEKSSKRVDVVMPRCSIFQVAVGILGHGLASRNVQTPRCAQGPAWKVGCKAVSMVLRRFSVTRLPPNRQNSPRLTTAVANHSEPPCRDWNPNAVKLSSSCGMLWFRAAKGRHHLPTCPQKCRTFTEASQQRTKGGGVKASCKTVSRSWSVPYGDRSCTSRQFRFGVRSLSQDVFSSLLSSNRPQCTDVQPKVNPGCFVQLASDSPPSNIATLGDVCVCVCDPELETSAVL